LHFPTPSHVQTHPTTHLPPYPPLPCSPVSGSPKHFTEPCSPPSRETSPSLNMPYTKDTKPNSETAETGHLPPLSSIIPQLPSLTSLFPNVYALSTRQEVATKTKKLELK
jgi:hypothetical protein